MRTKNKINDLYEEFPLLYKERVLERYGFASFGFECGDGWYSLLRDLSEKLQPFFEANPEMVVVQVKEKFGTLRFYLDGGTDEVYDLIDEAERKSGVTCEACGVPGQRRGGGWIRTLCDVCEDKRNKK